VACGCRGKTPRTHIDPTRAVTAAARVGYEVVPSQTATRGKRFSSMSAAQDYARRSGGIIRTIR